MTIDDHQVLLTRAYFYEVDEDAHRLDKIIHGAQAGDEESGYRMNLIKSAIQGRYRAFLEAGGPESEGTLQLMEAIDEAIAGFPKDQHQMAQARNLAREARTALTASALGR